MFLIDPRGQVREIYGTGFLRAEVVLDDIRPRDVITKESLRTATAMVAATGGSTNAALHLVAVAREAEGDFTVGVGVQIPIFNGFRRAANVQQARIELSRAEFQLAQLREAVQLQLEQARGEKERARSLIAARQRTVDQAERVYDLTTLQYEEGVTTQLEVSNARLALLQARSNLVQALADFYLADATLVRAQVAPGMGDARPTLPQNAAPEPAQPPAPTDLVPADDLDGQ